MSVIDYPVEGFQEKINATQTGYPVSNGGFWHNGIHFSGNTAITNICDGEIVALRLTDEYESSFSYPNDRILLSIITALFGLGGYLYYKYATNRPYMDRYFDLENNYYKLKPSLTEDDKLDAMNLIGELFSNNFILTKHDARTLQGKVITFYSLVMHLKPLKRLSNEQKMSLCWYEGQFTVRAPKYNAVAIRSSKKVVGEKEENTTLTTIPCETVIKTVEKGESTSKIEWILNETRYRAQIDTKFIRFDCPWGGKHDEIKRPANDADKKSDGWEDKYLTTGFSQQNGIVVYSTASPDTRVVKSILDSRYSFDIRKAKVFDSYNANPTNSGTSIEVEYRNSDEAKHPVTGFIYVAQAMNDIEKEDFVKFKSVITGSAETRKTFGGIEIRIRLKPGIEKNRIFAPDTSKLKKGETIGFAGYTLTTDRDGEKVVENEDATAIHYEIFASSDTFLTESKAVDLPCEYKIAETVTAQTGQLRTVQTPKTVIIDGAVLENLSNVYIRIISKGSLVEGEPFYKVKLLAKAVASSVGEYVIRDEAFTGWDDNTSTWKGKSSTSVSLYNSTGADFPDKTVTVYSDLFYRWKDQKDVKVEGKDKALRLPVWWYIKIPGEPVVYISEENLKKCVHIKTDDYILAEAVIPAAQLLEEPSQTAWSGEPVQLEREICDHAKILIVEHNIYSNKSDENVKNTWQKIKRRSDGSNVWIKVADIKNTRDGKPVERIRYNDWNYFFKKIDLKQAGTYKFSKLTASEFEKAGLPTHLGEPLEREVNRSISQTITGSPKPFGDILSSYGPAREYWSQCYYKNTSEWKKDDELTRALYANCRSYLTRTEKLRNGLQFWDDAKRLRSPDFPSSEENWYFHPKQFIDHLNKVVTHAEFNPYEEERYKTIYVGSGSAKGIDMNTTVVDNPGFAPYAGEGKGINGYTGISGFFDEDYLHVKRGNGKTYEESGYTVFTHEGIDFRGDSATEIHALIFGTVLAYGDFGPYGNSVFVARKNGKGVYLLAHLDRFNTEVLEGKDIAPRDILGYVGNTGTIISHLHITYFDWEYRERDKVVEGDGGELKTVGRYDKMYKDHRYNPFNHSEAKTPNILLPKVE